VREGGVGMGRIVVFDSGLGSLSVIKAIQRKTKSEIIYFADQKSFPYGTKSKKELEKIIKDTIVMLKEKFKPDLIIVGSNTPSLLLPEIFSGDPMVMGVLPPLGEAQRLTQTGSLALLVTRLVANSTELANFIKKIHDGKTKIITIDSSNLVDLVENGIFISDDKFCTEKIISSLQKKFIDNNVDVAILSSTHLPFLITQLTKIFPHVKFLDPADDIANQITKQNFVLPSKQNTLQIFSSGDVTTFQKKLQKLGMENTVRQINF
jgi:glutamate racemase